MFDSKNCTLPPSATNTDAGVAGAGVSSHVSIRIHKARFLLDGLTLMLMHFWTHPQLDYQ